MMGYNKLAENSIAHIRFRCKLMEFYQIETITTARIRYLDRDDIVLRAHPIHP